MLVIEGSKPLQRTVKWPVRGLWPKHRHHAFFWILDTICQPSSKSAMCVIVATETMTQPGKGKPLCLQTVTCDWVGGMGHKCILGSNDRLAQHSHLQMLMLQASLAQAGHCSRVPLRGPHCLNSQPHVLPPGIAAIPRHTCTNLKLNVKSIVGKDLAACHWANSVMS